MSRQADYVNNNIYRLNFTFRRQYDYQLYCLFEKINSLYELNSRNMSRNEFVKKAIIDDLTNENQTISDLDIEKRYMEFPKNKHYKKQFTISINKNSDVFICDKLQKIKKKYPMADYLRKIVYKYAESKDMFRSLDRVI